MNARQKAKKYKKLAQEFEEKAALYDIEMRTSAFQRSIIRQLQGQRVSLRFQRLYRAEEYIHQRAIKNGLANQIGEYLIENDLLYIESSIDERNDMIKLDCRLEVIKS